MNEMTQDTPVHTRPVSRRAMLGLAAGAAALAGLGLPAPVHALAPRVPPTTPDEALRALIEGNRRFVAGQETEPHRSMQRVRELAASQAPFAAILSCADSRVPVELVFDQGFGDLFVCRAAGNIATPELIGSLEFGTAVLGAKVLMVLGHSSCGAVKAAIENAAVPGQISSLYAHLHPAVRTAGPDVARTVEENVRVQTALLRGSSPVIAGLVRENKLKVVGGVYDLATGAVRMVDQG
ncbi:MAG TPA: carbonic anhydrase [Longimicrobium sp.]|jgi:carbonic anhydrase|uniref:carbonic anhydrase n=1 Tax=Longimicrobium sp. TaxID=2029185 RepID=UPI002ED86500